MALAMDTGRPALGVYYKTERATLADNFDEIIRRASGVAGAKRAAG